MKKIKEFIKKIEIVKWICIIFFIIVTVKIIPMMKSVDEKTNNNNFNNTYVQTSIKQTDQNNIKRKTDIFEIKKLENGSYGLGNGYLILIPTIILFIIIFKKLKKLKKEIQMSNIPQEDLVLFENLYNRLYKEHLSEFKKIRIINNLQKIINSVLIISMIILYLINIIYALLVLMGFLIITILWSIKKRRYLNNKKYISQFKASIVDPIIKLALPNAIYTPKDGISKSKYDEVNWDYYNIFYSEDLIEGKLKLKLNENKDFETNITMSEVLTQFNSKDVNGHRYTNTCFSGLISYITLPEDLGCEIHVIRGKGNKNRLNLDMEEFENLYDVETDNKIKAMEILTSDIMEDIVNITNRYKIDFRFDIQKNKLYFKFYTGKMFEPKTFNKSIEKIILKKYYNIVRMCVKTSKEICETLLKSNI